MASPQNPKCPLLSYNKTGRAAGFAENPAGYFLSNPTMTVRSEVITPCSSLCLALSLFTRPPASQRQLALSIPSSILEKASSLNVAHPPVFFLIAGLSGRGGYG